MGKKKTKLSFFNFPLVGEYFFSKGNLLFDWIQVLKLYVIKDYTTAAAGD